MKKISFNRRVNGARGTHMIIRDNIWDTEDDREEHTKNMLALFLAGVCRSTDGGMSPISFFGNITDSAGNSKSVFQKISSEIGVMSRHDLCGVIFGTGRYDPVLWSDTEFLDHLYATDTVKKIIGRHMDRAMPITVDSLTELAERHARQRMASQMQKCRKLSRYWGLIRLVKKDLLRRYVRERRDVISAEIQNMWELEENG